MVCVENAAYPGSLEVRKIYRRLPDPGGEASGLVRVIDESGEDYLYPASMFVSIAVPEAVEKVVAGAR